MAFISISPSTRLAAGASVLILGCAWTARSQGGMTDNQFTGDFGNGIRLFRQMDSDRVSCGFCHSADGIEIAAYNFSDATILRRATPHLGAKDAEGMVKFVHAVRKRDGIKKLLDPDKDRPLQPGGSVLAGSTPEERDAEFGRNLAKYVPTLATGTVDSEASALKSRDELLKADPWQIPIGIPFSRISEDKFHGKEHATLAHWIPDVDVPVHFPWGFMFDVQNNYINTPTEPLLIQMLEFPAVALRKYTLAQQMAAYKYRALLIYAHDIRMKAMGKPTLSSYGPVAFSHLGKPLLPNPLFQLGIFCDEKAGTDFKDFRFPDKVIENKSGGPSEGDQFKQIRLPSFWAGWLMDQGLQRIDKVPADLAIKAFTDRLWSDGPYPMHNAFMISKKLVTQSFVPEAWNSDEPQHFVLDYSDFIAGDRFKKNAPVGPAAAEYQRFVANSFRMSLFLLRSSLQKTHKKFESDVFDTQVPTMVAYLSQVDPENTAKYQALAKEIDTLSQP